jgi:hypothetical protein
LGELIYERQRHCRQHALTAALPPTRIHTAALPPACIHTAALPPVCSGTAAMRHCRQYNAAALPPRSVHSQRHCRQHAFAQRHCRQHAFTAALPPASTHSGIAAILSSARGSAAQSELMLPLRFFSVYLVRASIFWGATTTPNHACRAQNSCHAQCSCQATSDRL